MTRARQKPQIMPNPWPPSNIERLLEIAISTAGLAPTVYKLVALWIEDRKARKIRVLISEKEVEIETVGRVSDKEIERICTKARKILRESGSDDIKIILPPGVDHSIPFEMAKEAVRKKGG